MARFYFCLFIPIFYGPYWAYVSQALGYGFSFFFSILVGVGLRTGGGGVLCVCGGLGGCEVSVGGQVGVGPVAFGGDYWLG